MVTLDGRSSPDQTGAQLSQGLSVKLQTGQSVLITVQKR